MATPTYDLIQSSTLSSPTAFIFIFNNNSLPYRDIVITLETRSATTGSSTDNLRINLDLADIGTNKNYVTMTGNGSTATSEAQSNQSYIEIKNCRTSASSNTNNSLIKIDFLDYFQGDKHKTILWRKNDANGVAAGVGRQANTVTTNYFITLEWSSASNFVAGTTLNIYGIAG